MPGVTWEQVGTTVQEQRVASDPVAADRVIGTMARTAGSDLVVASGQRVQLLNAASPLFDEVTVSGVLEVPPAASVSVLGDVTVQLGGVITLDSGTLATAMSMMAETGGKFQCRNVCTLEPTTEFHLDNGALLDGEGLADNSPSLPIEPFGAGGDGFGFGSRQTGDRAGRSFDVAALTRGTDGHEAEGEGGNAGRGGAVSGVASVAPRSCRLLTWPAGCVIQGIKIVSSQVTLSGSVCVAGTDGVGGGGGGGGGSLIAEATGACVVKNVDATGGGADTGTWHQC